MKKITVQPTWQLCVWSFSTTTMTLLTMFFECLETLLSGRMQPYGRYTTRRLRRALLLAWSIVWMALLFSYTVWLSALGTGLRIVSSFLLIGTLVECHTLGWALSVSQWQLQSCSLLLSTATVIVYKWLWLTDWSFTQHVLNVTKVGTALLNCCYMAGATLNCCYLQSPCKFCVHHTTMHQFTVSLYLKPHTQSNL